MKIHHQVILFVLFLTYLGLVEFFRGHIDRKIQAELGTRLLAVVTNIR